MTLAGKRVLVTGGAGFIGSHLVEKLLQMEATVTVYDRFDGFYPGKEINLDSVRKSPAFRLVVGDILDKERLDAAVKGNDVVIHEAGQAGVRFSIEHPQATNGVNVTGTLNVLWSARSHGVSRVVNASSSSVFGIPQQLPIDEEHPVHPTSPYGVSKLVAEQYCNAFHRVFGMDVVSLRYFSVYGPRGRPDQVVYRFTKSLVDGQSPVINGDGSHTRDFTYVSDAVSATILAAWVDGIGGETFNIGYGARTSIRELAEKLTHLTGHEEIALKFVEESQGDFPDTQANNGKALRILGWKPITTLDTGLRSFLDWYEHGLSQPKDAE